MLFRLIYNPLKMFDCIMRIYILVDSFRTIIVLIVDENFF